MGPLFDEDATLECDGIGESMEIALKKTLFVFAQVRNHIKKIRRLDGHAMDNADEFERVHEQTRQVYKEFETQWPSFDTDIIEEALAAYGRGEYQLSEAFLDEKGDHPNTN